MSDQEMMEQKEEQEVLKLALAEDRETIVLKETQTAIVFNDDGTLELYFPKQEDEDAPAGPGALMCITVARSMVSDEGFWLKQLDEVFGEAEKLEEDTND